MRSTKIYWKDIAVMLLCFIGALLVALLIGVNKLPPPGPDIRVPKDTIERKPAINVLETHCQCSLT
jgi:hypothetical protein